MSVKYLCLFTLSFLPLGNVNKGSSFRDFAVPTGIFSNYFSARICRPFWQCLALSVLINLAVPFRSGACVPILLLYHYNLMFFLVLACTSDSYLRLTTAHTQVLTT
jgi:hypothetical protein